MSQKLTVSFGRTFPETYPCDTNLKRDRVQVRVIVEDNQKIGDNKKIFELKMDATGANESNVLNAFHTNPELFKEII